MSERMVLFLQRNLDWIELNGMPNFIGRGVYPFEGAMPLPSRFPRDVPQDILVWSQRGNKRWIYLGILREAVIKRTERSLTWKGFDRFERPVLVYDELGKAPVDDRRALNDGKDFCNDFAYISEASFAKVLEESTRSVED